jgi:hypothetical protein
MDLGVASASQEVYGDDERGKKKDERDEFLVDVCESDPLLSICGVDGE